jgi:hypothetical protein
LISKQTEVQCLCFECARPPDWHRRWSPAIEDCFQWKVPHFRRGLLITPAPRWNLVGCTSVVYYSVFGYCNFKSKWKVAFFAAFFHSLFPQESQWIDLDRTTAVSRRRKLECQGDWENICQVGEMWLGFLASFSVSAYLASYSLDDHISPQVFFRG